MNSQNALKKARPGSVTPRLLGGSPWALVIVVLVLGGGFYFGSQAMPQRAPAPTPNSWSELSLPLEPPVALLSIDNSGFPCDVERVLRAKCRRCHTIPSRHAAPFSLLTWDDTRQLRNGAPIFERMLVAVKSGAMPMRLAANPPVQPLTETEKQVLLEWLEQGAPRGLCPPS